MFDKQFQKLWSANLNCCEVEWLWHGRVFLWAQYGHYSRVYSGDLAWNWGKLRIFRLVRTYRHLTRYLSNHSNTTSLYISTLYRIWTTVTKGDTQSNTYKLYASVLVPHLPLTQCKSIIQGLMVWSPPAPTSSTSPQSWTGRQWCRPSSSLRHANKKQRSKQNKICDLSFKTDFLAAMSSSRRKNNNIYFDYMGLKVVQRSEIKRHVNIALLVLAFINCKCEELKRL